jgi:hypothetical protein
MKIVSAVLAFAPAVLAAALGAAPAQAQVEQVRSEARPLPRLVEKDGRFALLVDDAPFLIMGIEDLTMGDWPMAVLPHVIFLPFASQRFLPFGCCFVDSI